MAEKARIAPLRRGDVAVLTEVMARAFDDDATRHLGVEKGGPPGYDTGECLLEHGFDPRARPFAAILAGGATFGGGACR